MRDTLKIFPLNFNFFETIPKDPKSTTRAKQITLKGSKITSRGLKSTEKAPTGQKSTPTFLISTPRGPNMTPRSQKSMSKGLNCTLRGNSFPPITLVTKFFNLKIIITGCFK